MLFIYASLAPIDFAFRPTAYWTPAIPPKTVTLAEVVIDSVLGDTTWVTATPTADGRIALNIRDENDAPYAFEPKVVNQPLTLGELIDLINGAENLDTPELGVGLVFGFFEFSQSDDPNFVYVRSELYPQLDAYYEQALHALFEEDE